MEKNAELGAFTEEILSSLKLIISFGKEKQKLAEYDKLCELNLKASTKAGKWFSGMQGVFFFLLVGFSAYSWLLGFLFIKYEVENPITGKVTNTSEVMTTHQAMIFACFTVMAVQQLMPAVLRAQISGKEVIDVIDRVPKIHSPLDSN